MYEFFTQRNNKDVNRDADYEDIATNNFSKGKNKSDKIK